MTDPQRHTPRMEGVDPDHDAEPHDTTPDQDVEDLDDVPVDPSDPLKRDEEQDMPGLDPTPPPIAPD